MADLGEAVHVELADERVVVGVLEVLGEDAGGESVEVEDGEGVVVGRPVDDGAVLGILNEARGTCRIW